MKKLLICFALLGCNSTPTEEVPPVEFPVGLTVDIPCEIHGVDVNVITGNKLVRLYEISVEGQVVAMVTGETIANTLEQLGITVD